MHEASIVENLLGMVAGYTPAGSKVRVVHVRVGGFSGVSPDAMQFYFEALRGEWVGEQAQLVVERAPLFARCEACGREWKFVEPEWGCRECASTLVYTDGCELDLVAIEVEDVGDDPDRGEATGQERRAGRPEPATV